MVLSSLIEMSHHMRKPKTCIDENKGSDHLCSNCTADQRLCFPYINSSSTVSLLSKSVISSFLLFSVAVCVDLIENPHHSFSHMTAQIDCQGNWLGEADLDFILACDVLGFVLRHQFISIFGTWIYCFLVVVFCCRRQVVYPIMTI